MFFVDVTRNVPVFLIRLVDRHLDDAKIDEVGNVGGHDLGNALHGVLDVPRPAEPELVAGFLLFRFLERQVQGWPAWRRSSRQASSLAKPCARQWPLPIDDALRSRSGHSDGDSRLRSPFANDLLSVLSNCDGAAVNIRRREARVQAPRSSESMARRLVARLFGSGTSAGMSPPAMETPFGKIRRFNANRAHVALALDIHVDQRGAAGGNIDIRCRDGRLQIEGSAVCGSGGRRNAAAALSEIFDSDGQAVHVLRYFELKIRIALRPAADLHGADIDRKRTIPRGGQPLSFLVVDVIRPMIFEVPSSRACSEKMNSSPGLTASSYLSTSAGFDSRPLTVTGSCKDAVTGSCTSG